MNLTFYRSDSSFVVINLFITGALSLLLYLDMNKKVDSEAEIFCKRIYRLSKVKGLLDPN